MLVLKSLFSKSKVHRVLYICVSFYFHCFLLVWTSKTMETIGDGWSWRLTGMMMMIKISIYIHIIFYEPYHLLVLLFAFNPLDKSNKGNDYWCLFIAFVSYIASTRCSFWLRCWALPRLFLLFPLPLPWPLSRLFFFFFLLFFLSLSLSSF